MKGVMRAGNGCRHREMDHRQALTAGGTVCMEGGTGLQGWG